MSINRQVIPPQFTDAERARLGQLVTDLKNCLPMPSHKLQTVVSLVTAEAARFGCTYEEVMGRSRTRSGMGVSTKPIAQARQACMTIIRQNITEQGRPISYPRIGKIFGRDHSTVMSGVTRHLRDNPPDPPPIRPTISDQPAAD